MALKALPPSTNFQIHYEDTIANSLARAQAISGVCEREYAVLSEWFAIHDAFGPNDRIQVVLDQPDGSGAHNHGHQPGGKSTILLDVQSGNPNPSKAAEIVKMLFVLELVEVFMSYSNGKAGSVSWNPSDSAGEALSQLCSIERFRAGHYDYYPSFADSWLQTLVRPDFVTRSAATDGDEVSYGCGLLFLYYLHSQLGYSIPDIIQKGAATLEGTYQNLTGKSGGFAAFILLISQYFLPGSTRPFRDFDDPFPLLGPSHHRVQLMVEQQPTAAPAVFATGTAHVSPFGVTCAAKDYNFTINTTPRVLRCVATATGFGQREFSWRVNGVDVDGSVPRITIRAIVSVDDTLNPQLASSRVTDVTLFATVSSSDRQSTLEIDAAHFGHVDLEIEARVGERFVSGPPTTNLQYATVDNATVEWEPRYYGDRDACSAHWHEILNRYTRFRYIQILRTLPDPPPEYVRVMRGLEAVDRALRFARTDAPELVGHIESGIRDGLRLTPELVAEIGSQRAIPRKG